MSKKYTAAHCLHKYYIYYIFLNKKCAAV